MPYLFCLEKPSRWGAYGSEVPSRFPPRMGKHRQLVCYNAHAAGIRRITFEVSSASRQYIFVRSKDASVKPEDVKTRAAARKLVVDVKANLTPKAYLCLLEKPLPEAHELKVTAEYFDGRLATIIVCITSEGHKFESGKHQLELKQSFTGESAFSMVPNEEKLVTVAAKLYNLQH